MEHKGIQSQQPCPSKPFSDMPPEKYTIIDRLRLTKIIHPAAMLQTVHGKVIYGWYYVHCAHPSLWIVSGWGPSILVTMPGLVGIHWRYLTGLMLSDRNNNTLLCTNTFLNFQHYCPYKSACKICLLKVAFYYSLDMDKEHVSVKKPDSPLHFQSSFLSWYHHLDLIQRSIR